MDSVSACMHGVSVYIDRVSACIDRIVSVSVYIDRASVCTKRASVYIDRISVNICSVSVYIDRISAYIDGVSAYMDSISVYMHGVSAYIDRISAYIDGLSAYMDSVSVHIDGFNTYMGCVSVYMDTHTIWIQLVPSSRLPCCHQGCNKQDKATTIIPVFTAASSQQASDGCKQGKADPSVHDVQSVFGKRILSDDTVEYQVEWYVGTFIHIVLFLFGNPGLTLGRVNRLGRSRHTCSVLKQK